MKAIICIKSGSPEVLKTAEVEKPMPNPNEVLVKIYASSVTRGDVNLRKIPRPVVAVLGLIFGFKVMKIPGVEFSGIIEQVGNNIKQFKVGDEVFGTTTGLSYGGNAEYVCVPELSKKGVIFHKPNGISFKEAAVIPVGAMTAIHIFNKVKIKNGDKVLVYGASGSVGTYAVQLAKLYGADVIGVCSRNNFEMVKSIGADNIIDYKDEDVTKGEQKFNIIFDAVGKISKANCKRILIDDGKYLSIKSPTKEKVEYMKIIYDLIEKGNLKPVIDKVFSLDDVIEAHRYVEKGHKKGNVSIEVVKVT